MTFTEHIHCGACGLEFKSMSTLKLHLDRCVGAKVLLPFVLRVWSGADAIGHPIASIVSAFPKAGSLLRRYAMAVSSDVDLLARARLHRELCDILHVRYEDFRPFESSEIRKIPTFDEAEKILWASIEELLISV